MAIEAVASANSSRSGGQLSIQVNARDEADLAAFVRNRLPHIDGILCVQCMAVPLLIKDLAFWKPPAVAAFEQIGNPRRQTREHGSQRGESSAVAHRRQGRSRRIKSLLDGLDTGVVNASPGRASHVLARDVVHLAASPDRVVRYRVKRLLDRGAVLIQARLNPHKVGYPVVADVFVEVVPWKLDRCGREARRHGTGLLCERGSPRPRRRES